MVGVACLMNFSTPESLSWYIPVNEDGSMGVINLAKWLARSTLSIHEEDHQTWKEIFLMFQNMIKVSAHLRAFFMLTLFIYTPTSNTLF
jgi:hypothetical protein